MSDLNVVTTVASVRFTNSHWVFCLTIADSLPSFIFILLFPASFLPLTEFLKWEIHFRNSQKDFAFGHGRTQAVPKDLRWFNSWRLCNNIISSIDWQVNISTTTLDSLHPQNLRKTENRLKRKIKAYFETCDRTVSLLERLACVVYKVV